MPNDYFHLELYELDANARVGRGARDSIEEDSAGNNYRNTDLCVLPMHIDEVSGKAPSMNPSLPKTILKYLRKPSPYLSLGLLLLPGGSLLLLWLFQQVGRK
jgi:hypothetical protein